MEHPVAFRLQAGHCDDEVLPIGVNRRGPLHRKVTAGRDELGREWRMPVNNLRVEIRMRSTAYGG